MRHPAQVASRVRTGNYSQDARWRLAIAVKEAREAAGYRKRPAFCEAAGVSKRSLENVESLEPGAASVGEAVLHAIGRALPNWNEDTPRVILEGGPIPGIQRVPADISPADSMDELAPLDEILDANLDDLKKIAKLYAHFEARRERRTYKEADERKFVLWALRKQEEHERDIKPPAETNRDVS